MKRTWVRQLDGHAGAVCADKASSIGVGTKAVEYTEGEGTIVLCEQIVPVGHGLHGLYENEYEYYSGHVTKAQDFIRSTWNSACGQRSTTKATAHTVHACQ
jgi:hypothetical protein